MDKITEEIINKIEKEYNADTKKSVVAHGLYTIHRIKREVAERENLTKHNSRKTKSAGEKGVVK